MFQSDRLTTAGMVLVSSCLIEGSISIAGLVGVLLLIWCDWEGSGNG